MNQVNLAMHTDEALRKPAVIEPARCRLADADSFLERLNCELRQPLSTVAQLFNSSNDLIVTRAPGRLDVMGGIADYSGSLVLELPIAEAVFVALQVSADRLIRIASPTADVSRDTEFEISLDQICPAGVPLTYDAARERFGADPRGRWAAYVAGAYVVLMRERGICFQNGANILIDSAVPEGLGVSSSAALEVAALTAVAAAYDVGLSATEIALLCHKVENDVVGAPCGVMDQVTVACGQQDRLLALLCQPMQIRGNIALPLDLGIWGLDSGTRHSVGGVEYGAVRIGAFMGYRMLADMAGFDCNFAGTVASISDDRWHGYLANISPSEFEQSLAQELPLDMSGAEFLQRYRGTTDPVTSVDPKRTYAVRLPAAHAVYEHFRVRCFAELLTMPRSERRDQLLGELMYQSHASYSACGLGSDGTDQLVAAVRAADPALGLLGAKITGGGSGGTVAVLGRADALPNVERVAEAYALATGHQPYVFKGSSPGSGAFGHVRLRL